MSDDTPEFSARQKAHGEKVRMERNIMDTYGVSRSQARAALKGVQEFQRRIEVTRRPVVVSQATPGIVFSEVRQELPPKLHEPPRAVTAGLLGSAAGGGTVTLTLCKNGIPTDYILFGSEA